MSSVKETFVKEPKDVSKLYFIYYVLSFVVLFFNVFVYKSNSMDRDTYIFGFVQFASGLGWFYYLANLIGIASTVLKPLNKLESIFARVISAFNIFISCFVLFQLIPDVISPSAIIDMFGSRQLGMGFWIIILYHIIGFTIIWFKTLKKYYKKHKAKQALAEN